MGSFITGNLLTAILLSNIQHYYTVAIVLTVLALISTLPFLMLRKPEEVPSDEVCEDEEEHFTVREEIVQTWDMMFSKRMRPLIPLFIATTLADTLTYISFIPFFTFYMVNEGYTQQEEDHLALIAMIFFGVGSIVGCVIFG